MVTVLVADPAESLQPYAEERRAAADLGATFVLGDDRAPRHHDAEVILISALPVTAATMRELARCRLIVRYGIGVDMIDVAAATACGIVVANAPTYCVAEVADHAAGLILSITRRIPAYDREMRATGWSVDDPQMQGLHRLSGLTLGIIGLGRIGRQLAQRMRPFGFHVLGHDPHLSDATIAALDVTPATFTAILRLSDIISLHVPLTASTHHLIDGAALALMKPTAILVNTSRGAIVDEAALIRALSEERLYGVALDVLESEPPDPANPLLGMDPRRVILTPHAAAASVEAIADLHREVAAAVAAVLAGRWPRATLNPDVVPKAPLRHGA